MTGSQARGDFGACPRCNKESWGFVLDRAEPRDAAMGLCGGCLGMLIDIGTTARCWALMNRQQLKRYGGAVLSALMTRVNQANKQGDAPSITCPRCKMTSYHWRDIAEQYCGKCHKFHPDE